VIVTLATFLADLGFYVIYDVELSLKPMNLANLSADSLTTTELANHRSTSNA